MLKVHEINAIDDLASLRAYWADLLANTPGGTFFQSLPWLETYWRFFGPDGPTPENHSLRVLVVEADGKPIGVVPLVVTIERRRIGAVRVLGYPLHGWGSFLRTDWTGPDDGVNRGAAAHSQHAARLGFDRSAVG